MDFSARPAKGAKNDSRGISDDKDVAIMGPQDPLNSNIKHL